MHASIHACVTAIRSKYLWSLRFHAVLVGKLYLAHGDTRQDSELEKGLDSAKEVDDNKVEDQVAEEEVGKGTLLRDVLELGTVLGVDLDAQTNCTIINKKNCIPSRD